MMNQSANLKNKRVLVFGGAGFIGSHLAERLIADGASVTVYDNLKTGRTANLAAEGLISAWAHTYDLHAVVFRFVGIIGGRMDHGVVHDFIRKLQKDPSQLEVLGDGTQQRSFVLVDDCVEAMLFAFANATKNYNLVHIGNVDQISINRTAEAIFQVMNLKNVTLQHTGGKVGWKGDVTSNLDRKSTR